MAYKSDLKALEADCFNLIDWINLGCKALEKPVDKDYAAELASIAESYCSHPDDFVHLAAFSASKLRDPSLTANLLEQAEEACFDVMEFAEVGYAYVTLLNLKEKGQELIQYAVKNASGDELVTLAVMVTEVGDDELAKTIVAGLVSDMHELVHFKKMANRFVELGSADLAIHVTNEAKRVVDSVEEIVEYGDVLMSIFGDVDKVRHLLEKTQKYCLTPSDFIVMAFGYRDLLGDRDKIAELLQQGAESCKNSEEFIAVAQSFWDLLHDSESARNYFKKALPKLDNRTLMLEIASTIAIDLEDLNLAHEYFEHISEKFDNPGDLARTALESWEKTSNGHDTGILV